MSQPNTDGMWANFKKDINLGSVIQLLVLVATIIYTFAVIQKDVEANRATIIQMQENISNFRKKVSDTYVRKDVQGQILLRLQDIRDSQKRLEDKMDEIQNER